MKRLRTAALATCILSTCAALRAQTTARIGTFDSRAIAVAYARSDMGAQFIASLVAERDRAKAAGDEQKVREVEARAKAHQARLHGQGFSTASVALLLEKIKPELASVAKDAKVSLIVSKWEVIYADPSIEYVDVTMRLVQKFTTDPSVIKVIEELLKHDPIPSDVLVSDEH